MRVGTLLFSPVRWIVGRRDLAAVNSGEDSPHIHKEHPGGKTGEKIFNQKDANPQELVGTGPFHQITQNSCYNKIRQIGLSNF